MKNTQKQSNMEDDTFLLKEEFSSTLSFEDLKVVTSLYNAKIKEDKFTIPNLSTLDFMLWAKRKKLSFGPYRYLTFFEISNRIYSDKVLTEDKHNTYSNHHYFLR